MHGIWYEFKNALRWSLAGIESRLCCAGPTPRYLFWAQPTVRSTVQTAERSKTNWLCFKGRILENLAGILEQNISLSRVAHFLIVSESLGGFAFYSQTAPGVGMCSWFAGQWVHMSGSAALLLLVNLWCCGGFGPVDSIKVWSATSLNLTQHMNGLV